MLKLDWDEGPPSEIYTRWERYKSELSALTSIRISHTMAVNNVVRRELHGFCDVNEQGYGAVVYLRIVAANNVVIRMLGAKSKVVPLKPLILPRLELCAAVLFSDLLHYIRDLIQNEIAIEAIYT